MLILKGNVYKSAIVNQLMHNEFNECIIWDEPEMRTIYPSWIINDTLETLYKSIIKFNNALGDYGENRDLLIIYTNKLEEEIFPLIEWIKEQEKYLLFRQVLITCR